MIPPFRSRLAASLTLLLALVAQYALGRGVFLWLNAEVLLRQTWQDIVFAFLHGLRFDVASLCVLNAPVLLALILPVPAPRAGRWKMFGALRAASIVLLNVPFLWLGIADAEYYKFTGKRSGADLAVFAGDAAAQAASLAQQYWALVLIALVQGVFVVYVARFVEQRLSRGAVHRSSVSPEGPFSPHTKPQKLTSGLAAKAAREVVFVAVFGAAVALGIRGGLQRKPLTTTHAYVFEANILNVFSLNSTLTVLHAGRHKGVPSLHAFAQLEDAREAWLTLSEQDGSAETVLSAEEAPWRLLPSKTLPPGGRFNIVVLVVESLGREFMGTGHSWAGDTPFLDSLAKRGLLFDDAFANGRRSIEAPWSIFAGIPSLMDEPYVSSAYKDNRLPALPRLLRQEGYSSAFFHGGKNGTMFFDTFARMSGFQRYVGMNEAPSALQKSAYDGTWGLFDGPFLDFVAQEMGLMPEPFLGGVFTLSSHNPYALPADLPVEQVERFTKDIKHPLQKVLRYADASLEDFFAAASKAPWYDRTLFVVTGDHTSSSQHESYQNDVGFNRVPILLFAPSLEFKHGLARKLAQHTDISCTALSFAGKSVGLRAPRTPFCRSLVEEGGRGRVLLHAGGTYNLVTPRYWTRRTPDGRQSVFPFLEREGWGVSVSGPGARKGKGALVDEESAAFLEKTALAGIQVFNNGLNEDALFFPMPSASNP